MSDQNECVKERDEREFIRMRKYFGRYPGMN